jgi:ion channel-forming bestrophin family protein
LLPPLHIGRKLATWVVLATVYAAAVKALVYWLELPYWSAGKEVAAILSVALWTLVAFRNNAANDRWWEARKLWGQLINDSRNLVLKVRAYADVDVAEKYRFGRLLVGFANALRIRLREDASLQSVPGLEDMPPSFPHPPGYLAGKIHETLARWDHQKKVHESVFLLDIHARSLMDICGACERIKNTPLASSYRAMKRGAITLYVLIAPWAVGLDIGFAGLPILVLAFAFLMGVELTAEAVEEPFGHDGDDLALDAYCRTIESFVNAVLPPAEPARG